MCCDGGSTGATFLAGWPKGLQQFTLSGGKWRGDTNRLLRDWRASIRSRMEYLVHAPPDEAAKQLTPGSIVPFARASLRMRALFP